MAAFRFRALSAQGKEEKGVLEADSARAARGQLRERGLFPVEVENVAGGDTGAHGWLVRQRLSHAELVMFTEQLSTLLEAGLPLEKALLAVVDQSEQVRVRSVIASIRSEILAGQSFAQALNRQTGIFSPLYRSLVQAGELTGHLDQVMSRLAVYLSNRQKIQQKVSLALVYPAVVTLVAIMVITALMTYVVPQVVGVFVQTRQTLPFLTRALMQLSQFMKQWGAVCLVVLVGVMALVYRVLKIPRIRYRFHLWLLGLPVLGRLFRAINTARMSSTLAILVGSGVPLLTAMETARGLVSLLPMQEAMTMAIERVKEGGMLSRALAASKQFPPVLIHLIGSGEASGTLAHMLNKAADQQQSEVDRKLATLTTLMEPMLILFMGGIVLFIVLAIMQPIIDMNQMIH